MRLLDRRSLTSLRSSAFSSARSARSAYLSDGAERQIGVWGHGNLSLNQWTTEEASGRIERVRAARLEHRVSTSSVRIDHVLTV